MRRRLVGGVALVLALLVGVLVTTDDPRVWPYRNALRYLALKQLGTIGTAANSDGGTVSGVVRSSWGQPIAGARVLLSAPDGTTWSAESDAVGRYRIADVPPGRYVPVAGAPGFDDAAVRTWLGLVVRPGASVPFDLTLTPRDPRPISAPRNVRLSAPQTWQIERPLPARAVRRELHFTVDGQPNQQMLFYTPVDGQATPLPTLLTVYPGPADTWESVSLPLAQAGYAVLAVGPAYALDLERDVDDLARVVDLIEAGLLPRADSSRIGALGGSYSGLHVLRLAVRDPDAIDAALLLGPPTDLFELRRQFEDGSFFPPFGLDQAMIALGLPGDQPERYWRYSALFHARSLDLPLMLIHSKADEVVPFTQSELLAAELRRLQRPVELHILDGMGHYLLATERTPAIDDLFQTTTDFFDGQLRHPDAAAGAFSRSPKAAIIVGDASRWRLRASFAQ